MLVVISDLHFEEEESNYIEDPDNEENSIKFSRNLTREAYKLFVARLAKQFVQSKARRLDLVFAGDIFDLHRTGLWFKDNPKNLRPYHSNSAVSKALQEKLVEILRAIQNAQGARDALGVFRLLAKGYYLDDGLKKFPADPDEIKFHYIPGNHDRLVNATPKLRACVRRALGMKWSGEPFPNILTFPHYHTIVRHGHEYDPYNFSIDVTEKAEIDLNISKTAYDDAPVGDLVTVDIASHIPHLMREIYGEKSILSDPVLKALYLRLLEFDDLRPQSALLNYLIFMPAPKGGGYWDWEEKGQGIVWEKIKPLMSQLLHEIHHDKFLWDWLNKLNKRWTLDIIDIIQFVFTFHLWPWVSKLPLNCVKRISTWAVERVKSRPGPQVYAAREKAIANGDFHFLVGGHTHHPATELIANDEEGERYYIDTGTWRNQVPATPNYDAFGRLKALTYAVIFGSDEDLGDLNAVDKFVSLDYWSGVTQRWSNGEAILD